MKNVYVLILLISFLSCNKPNEAVQSPNTKKSEINLVFDKIEKFLSSPQDSLYRGMHPEGEWNSYSLTSQSAQRDSVKGYIDKINSISNSTLSEQEIISKKVMLIRLQDIVSNIDYKMNLIPFNAEGGFYNEMAFVLPNLPFNKAEDYDKYLKWLPNYNLQLKDNIDLIKEGLKLKIVAPKIIVKNTMELLKPWAVTSVEESPFYEPLIKMPSEIRETERKNLNQRATVIISELLETYAELNRLMSNEYVEAAMEKPGIAFIPGGKEYYENRVNHYTTLSLSPDSVHNLGLSEVKRIRSAMDNIIMDLGFKGSFADFLVFLRTDEQFFPKTPQDLLNYASWLSKKAEGQLPKYFNKLYSLPFTVEPVPMSIAPTYTTGRYVEGSFEAKRAGIYWVNTYNLPSRTLYTMPSLTLHEAVPGHHLQNAIASELKNLPRFRTTYYISAFGEGWGLYSEYLGEEMGMYTTPYELFGRYTYEMWRACRLVVDTGIHYKGWSRQQALDFMGNNTALSIHEVTTEIDRYIGWPGQALSYKIGEIKIKALRQKSEEALKDKFDIREFHNVILKNGSIPLAVLEEQVDEYIKEALNSDKK